MVTIKSNFFQGERKAASIIKCTKEQMYKVKLLNISNWYQKKKAREEGDASKKGNILKGKILKKKKRKKVYNQISEIVTLGTSVQFRKR